jgi:hypothetical protein
MDMNHSHFFFRNGLLAVVAALGMGAAGCSSVPNDEVESQLTSTETSLTQAEQSGAQERALTELQHAKNKFAEAKAAYEDGDEEEALRLAKEAQVDAQYAAARSQALQDQEGAASAQKGIEDVRGAAAAGSTP